MQYLLRMNPSNRVRELRKKTGLSQAQLANLAGISQPAISQIENDTRPLTVDWMRTLARILGCTPADLLAPEDNPDRLAPDERELVQNFREADDAQREMIHRVSEPIARPKPFDEEGNVRHINAARGGGKAKRKTGAN